MEKRCQVSTHEYADAALIAYYVPMTNPTYIPNFGINTNFTVIKVGNGDIGNTINTSNLDISTTTPSRPSTLIQVPTKVHPLQQMLIYYQHKQFRPPY